MTVVYTVPKVIDFPQYNMICIVGENVILYAEYFM